MRALNQDKQPDLKAILTHSADLVKASYPLHGVDWLARSGGINFDWPLFQLALAQQVPERFLRGTLQGLDQ